MINAYRRRPLIPPNLLLSKLRMWHGKLGQECMSIGQRAHLADNVAVVVPVVQLLQGLAEAGKVQS